MIDTVKFLIPINDTDFMNELKKSFKRFRKDDLKTGEIEFEFFSSNIEVGSYNRTVSIKISEFPYGLFIEFSAPKYLKGNNVEMIYPEQLENIVKSLYKDLCKFTGYRLPNYTKWIVYRLDVCYNWLMKDEAEAVYAMNFLRRIDFPRKRKYTYDTSVMHIGSSYVLKFYAKGPEFKKNDFKKIDYERALELKSIAYRIVRFEIGIKRNYLEFLFKKKKVFLDDIIKHDIILSILKFYLEKKVFCYINIETMTNEKIKSILFSKFTKKKATRLYQFNKDFYHNDEMKDMFLSGGLDRSTIYRYKKDLKNAGIGISEDLDPDTTDVVKKLIIPSPDSRFDLIDKENDKV